MTDSPVVAGARSEFVTAARRLAQADEDGRHIGDRAVLELLQEYMQTSGDSLDAALDSVSVEVGQLFVSGGIKYEDADWVMNALWIVMTQQRTIPDLAYAVFNAFDQGEFDHGDGIDPVETYTIPLLHAAIDGHGEPA